MSIPEDVKNEAAALVSAYCAGKVPEELADEIRIDHEQRGRTITIYERRPPWREDLGPEWTAMRICTLQWDPDSGLWTLYARDRNDRRLDYPCIGPTPSVEPLLEELDADPTGIFWG